MTSTDQVFEKLANSPLFNVQSQRYALRCVMHSSYAVQRVLDNKVDLFGMIARSLAWESEDLTAVWERINVLAEGRHCRSGSHLGELLELCINGEEIALDACHLQAVAILQTRREDFFRMLERSLGFLDQAQLTAADTASNLRHVCDLYGLDECEAATLEIAYLSSTRIDFKTFLTELKIPSTVAVWDAFAGMAGVDAVELQLRLRSTQKLVRSGLVKLDAMHEKLSGLVQLGMMGDIVAVQRVKSQDELLDRLLPSIGLPSVGLNEFEHLKSEIGHTVRYLSHQARDKTSVGHILIHGPSGVGKLELAKGLILAAQLGGYMVPVLSPLGQCAMDPEERVTRAYWADALLANRVNAVLVFDDIEEVVQSEKPLLLAMLQQLGVPTICICTETAVIDDSVLRHFVFHIHLTPPPASARKAMAHRMLPFNGKEYELVDAIANSSSVAPAQMFMAARFAASATAYGEVTSAQTFHSAMNAAELLKGGKLCVGEEPSSMASWDFESLHLEASAPMPRIIEALRRRQSASLAFYGIPGTGKTSLARYIARELDRPFIAKRVSDLSSKWVGETEKLISRMFQEADADNAVLLLDEGDSFLQDRRKARSPWEITQVNELLQQMESFSGIFICATNLIEDIDSAALRRFTFKVKFLPLDSVRKMRMFARYALEDPEASIPTEILSRLATLDNLAPGDFATIRRQENILGEKFSAQTWINELEAEHAMRAPSSKRRAAFV